MSYLGTPPFGQTVRTETSVNATASQTTFTPTGGYTVGYVDVFYNGVKLVAGTDFTASDGLTVVLTTGATANAIVTMLTYGTVSMADAVRRSGDTFSGAVTFSANTSTTGAATFSNTIAVTGNATFSNTIAVTGTANVAQGLTANTLTVTTNTATFGTAVYHVANGNVGIGVSTPANMLTVAGGTVDIRSASGDSNGLKMSMDGSGIGYINAGYTSSNIVFQTGGVERFRISNTGVAVLTAGILFPATQVVSSNANILDDYEEGTFTPNLVNNGGTSTWAVKIGRYTKVGAQINFWCYFDAGGPGSGGALILSGLPFSGSGSGSTMSTIGTIVTNLGSSSTSWYPAFQSSTDSNSVIWTGGSQVINASISYCVVQGSYNAF